MHQFLQWKRLKTHASGWKWRNFLSTFRDAKWVWHIVKLLIAIIICTKFHLKIDSQNIFASKISCYTVYNSKNEMIQRADTATVKDSISQTVIFEILPTAIASSAIDLTSWIGEVGFDHNWMPIHCHIKIIIMYLRLTLKFTYCILLFQILNDEPSPTAVMPSGQWELCTTIV